MFVEKQVIRLEQPWQDFLDELKVSLRNRKIGNQYNA